MELPFVSVIIPSWNRCSDLRRTLNSIFSQSYKNIEVFVVDNGSNDGSSEMVKKEFPNVSLIQNKENLGVAIAKNQAVLQSRGEYLLFCDSDIEMMHKDCIANMLKIIQENPDIGALGGEAYKTSENDYETKKKMITINCETNTIVLDKKDYELENCNYVATCNCMIRRKLLEECGGFNSSIIYGGEDKELGVKLKKKGYKNAVDSRCLVYHYISQTTKHRNFYALNKNRIKIVILNYSPFHILALPVLDFIMLFNPKRFADLKQEKIDMIKYGNKVKSKGKNGQFLLTKVLNVGADYIRSLIKAYTWNLAHLPETIKIRIKNINYLEQLKNGQLKDIKNETAKLIKL